MDVAKLLYDAKCYDLAEHFLPDGAEEKLKNSLAYEIQIAVEDWLQENEAVEEYPDPRAYPLADNH